MTGSGRPVLEPVELHERKSGAGIVSKLFEVEGPGSARVCLRPEMTAGIVRAYASAELPPAIPWRVSHAGLAFRRESPGRADRLREFRQVGVERLGDGGPGRRRRGDLPSPAGPWPRRGSRGRSSGSATSG